MITVYLDPADFTTTPRTLLASDEFRVETKRYSTGIAALTLHNTRGSVEVLPYLGQIIWNATMDDHCLRMKNMFLQPQPARDITDTYGCFAFHSGLLTAGVPGPEDTHPMHGEFATATMDSCWLTYDGAALSLYSQYEYVKGFGHHYSATPSVTLHAGQSRFDIGMRVENLSAYAPMPVQYMCHINHAFVHGGIMSESVPAGAFQLRHTIPDHITPTPQWRELNEAIVRGEVDTHDLSSATSFDPEIVYMADNLPQYGERVSFELSWPDGTVSETSFATADFPVATRWILYNADQQVAAYVLPGTSRPEGFTAARKAGTLIELQPGEVRTFRVTTGIKEG